MSNPAYDPDDPEGSPRRSSYLSGRDIKVLGIVLVVFIILLAPVYSYYANVSRQYQCKRNMKEIFESINLYAAEWNDRYPPLYVVAGGEREAPMLDSAKRPFTWGSLIQRFAKREGIFKCPSADESENLLAQDPQTTKKSVAMSYGMYVGLASQPSSLVRSPATTVIVSETSNHGANGTFNPVPLYTEAGEELPYDGFIIGYSDSNTTPSPKTTSVTRLAFKGTQNGKFNSKNEGRHFGKNHFLFASGQVAVLTADAARVKMLGESPTGNWERP
ncbi:MAG: hypothetical protein K1X67_09965 [Fimbriimonadaceae bacterium]|nr:hypothetical protein [Fimbriimonadaceae bacterium]